MSSGSGRRWSSFAIAATLAATAGVAFALRSRPAAIEQPIAFDHRLHVTDEGLDCLECHAGADRSAHAGLPDIRLCHDCHADLETRGPDSARVREYGERREQLPFVQVDANAGHVYFSHRVHVVIASMDCSTCHGDASEWNAAARAPDPTLHSMERCMDCHRAEGASLECLACHQ